MRCPETRVVKPYIYVRSTSQMVVQGTHHYRGFGMSVEQLIRRYPPYRHVIWYLAVVYLIPICVDRVRL